MFVLSSAIHEVRFDNNYLGISAIWDTGIIIKYLKYEQEVETVELGEIPTFEMVHDLTERYFLDADTNSRFRKTTT